ncbi:MAG: hypothetical protein GY765_27010 [bacterium]|nr:hypothetical protein [bacterium]
MKEGEFNRLIPLYGNTEINVGNSFNIDTNGLGINGNSGSLPNIDRTHTRPTNKSN